MFVSCLGDHFAHLDYYCRSGKVGNSLDLTLLAVTVTVGYVIPILSIITQSSSVFRSAIDIFLLNCTKPGLVTTS